MFLILKSSHSNRHARAIRVAAVVLVLFLGKVQTPSLAQDSGTPGAEDSQPTCFDGRLRIRDLEGAQDSLEPGVAAINKKAAAWESDARLNTLRLVCPLLETGYQWQGTYFSESAQAFYSTDTGAVEAAEEDPDKYPTLDATGIRFSEIYTFLQRAGFGDQLVLGGVGGVTVRRSTDAQPFGPESAPRDAIYFHVAVLQQGEVIDVWIAAADGTIYRYD